MGALDQLGGANGDGLIERARTNPRWAVAVAAGAVLILAWIGWAIYVASDNGPRAGLGVVIAWPAMLAALALFSLPFIAGYLLIRRLSEDSGPPATAGAEAPEDEEEQEEDSDEEPEDSAEEEESGDDDEGSDNESMSDPEAKTKSAGKRKSKTKKS